MSNLRFRNFYRRRLPHIQIAGATYFVTFRLANSLPVEVLDKLAAESHQNKHLPPEQATEAYAHWFQKLDEYLDKAGSGDDFLEHEQVAGMVAEALRFRDGNVYDLIAFCIMPNHVHLVFIPLEMSGNVYYSLTEILHSLKRHTARQANLLLARSGAFWQDESYDHIIRDEAELERTIQYIIYNPVKAGLVTEISDWKWTYCKYEM